MKKILIIGLAILLIFTLTGCEDGEEDKNILDKCILDETCSFEAVRGFNNPDEVMFDMIETYSLENDFYMPVEELYMAIDRDLNDLELNISHSEIIYDLSEEYFGEITDMLVELYDLRRAAKFNEVIKGLTIAAMVYLGLYLLIYFSFEPNSSSNFS